VIIEVRFTDEDVERIAARLAERLAKHQGPPKVWLDVTDAAAHLGLTENAIRGLVKRKQIPFHRTKNGRLRFAVTELDHWVRTGACATSHEDLP
jgi:excisionase family DNA binding protein